MPRDGSKPEMDSMETQLSANRKESRFHETTGRVRLELSVPDASNASCPLNF